MNETAAKFVGSIPENYDEGLGPYIFEGFAADLANRAARSEVKNVLEIAAGTGIASHALRGALPNQARLVITDLNPPMLDVARSKFDAGDNVAFLPADALDLSFEDGEFDLVVCQFGAMFFPDKQAAFREARRVLTSGGEYLFNVWGTMAANPFSEVVYETTERFFPDDPPEFYKVPFGYSDPNIVTKDLAASGFTDVDQEFLEFDKEVRDWNLFARGLVFGNPLVEEINNRATVTADEVVAGVELALQERFGPSPASMPLSATIFSARTA